MVKGMKYLKILIACLILSLVLVPTVYAVEACSFCEFINISKGDKGDTGAPGASGVIDETWNLSYPLLDGTRAFTGIVNMGGFNLSNLLNPVLPQDAATKWYVDSLFGASGGSILQDADNHIATNRSQIEGEISTNLSTVSTWISTNKSEILASANTSAASMIASNQTGSTLQTADNHIASNLSTVSTWILENKSAVLVTADNHIATNLSVAIASANTSAASMISTNLSGSIDLTWNASYFLKSGARIMTGSFNAGGFNVSNITNITADSDAVNKSFVEHSPTITNLSATYPIGTVYLTTLGTDPHDIFGGFGTWQDLGYGYVLVGV